MSRIHEALKKAEQERAASQAASGLPNFPASIAAEPPMATGTEAPAAMPAAAESASHAPFHPAMPSFANSLGLDAMLARCQRLQWQPDKKTMLFFNGDDSARGTEEFRTLRSRLYHTREKMTLKKILVTSALPKEGKSFTAANLAQVMVKQHGRRVLLIDADLRGPRLHAMLGTTSSPGLTDYLQGGGDEFSIMQRGPMENLFFIPSGHQISEPAELVANGRLKFLLQRVEPLFDWIVIDSPPAVPVSDAGVLAKVCDGVLMVVRSNATPIEMARRAREEFPDEALVGVVLNGTDKEATPYSRYYYEAYVKDSNESKP
ncbi:MAG: CpsD/CapB family tyrosine-protein kinase [Acidobacteriaceae bacterium]